MTALASEIKCTFFAVHRIFDISITVLREIYLKFEDENFSVYIVENIENQNTKTKEKF